MRNKMFAMAVLLLSLLAGSTQASDYSFNGTYYYNSAGQAFTRTRVVEYYWANGCRYPRVAWQYTPVNGVYGNITAQTENWRSKLLDIAGAHKRYQDQIAASANEHQEFLEAVKELGLSGVVNNYGFAPQYANAAQYAMSPGLNVQSYAQQSAPQGATLYGYREVADIYGNVNLGEIYNRALRLREQSAQHEETATSNTIAAVDALGARAAAIEEMRAKASLMSKLVDGLKAESTTKIVREYWSANDVKRNPAGVANGVARDLTGLIQTKCLACHNAKERNGDLDLTDLSLLDATSSRKILERIDSADPAKRMPLAPGLKPGTPLSLEEKALFFLAAYGVATKE